MSEYNPICAKGVLNISTRAGWCKTLGLGAIIPEWEERGACRGTWAPRCCQGWDFSVPARVQGPSSLSSQPRGSHPLLGCSECPSSPSSASQENLIYPAVNDHPLCLQLAFSTPCVLNPGPFDISDTRLLLELLFIFS